MAAHQRQCCPDDDVELANGLSIMNESTRYKKHLDISKNDKEVRNLYNI